MLTKNASTVRSVRDIAAQNGLRVVEVVHQDQLTFTLSDTKSERKMIVRPDLKETSLVMIRNAVQQLRLSFGDDRG